MSILHSQSHDFQPFQAQNNQWWEIIFDKNHQAPRTEYSSNKRSSWFDLSPPCHQLEPSPTTLVGCPKAPVSLNLWREKKKLDWHLMVDFQLLRNVETPHVYDLASQPPQKRITNLDLSMRLRLPFRIWKQLVTFQPCSNHEKKNMKILSMQENPGTPPW